MKIFRFPGVIIGICVHLVVFVVLVSNPGCSSSAKPQPAKSDTVTKADAPPPITVASAAAPASDRGAAPISFGSDSVRYSPTRPGTPAASTLEVEPVSNVTPASTYTVVGGDNLSVIAKKNHLAVAELAAANNLNVNTAKLHPGQKLIVPSKAPASVKPSDVASRGSAVANPTPSSSANTSATKTPAEGLKHTVQTGENLSSIAQKYGVKFGDIAAANSIVDPKKIRPGMELIIPGWQSVAGKATRSTKSGSDANARQTSAPAPATTPTTVNEPGPQSRPPAGEVPVIQVEEASAPAK